MVLLYLLRTRSMPYTHSVGLLWTSDRSDAETSSWQHTTLTTDRQPCPRRDPNPQSQKTKRPKTHACRPRGHWHQKVNDQARVLDSTYSQCRTGDTSLILRCWEMQQQFVKTVLDTLAPFLRSHFWGQKPKPLLKRNYTFCRLTATEVPLFSDC